jgi:LPS-assembly lipoprotein
MIKRAAIALLLAVSAAGCGFQPLYAPSAFSGQPAIGPVEVGVIRGKSGHALKLELDRLLAAERRSEAEIRRLDIELTESVVGLGYTVNEAATRNDLILVANYTLSDSKGGAAAKGRLEVTVSYDIPPGAFAEIAAQDNARERAAAVMAERIRTDLALRLAAARAPAKT